MSRDVLPTRATPDATRKLKLLLDESNRLRPQALEAPSVALNDKAVDWFLDAIELVNERQLIDNQRRLLKMAFEGMKQSFSAVPVPEVEF